MDNRYLFKAKRVDNGKWVQGYYYQMWENGYILWGMTNDVPNMIEVDVSTICQCTGLKDKNGELIFENDIIERLDIHDIKGPSIGIIEYDVENTSFLIHWTDIANYSPTFHWKNRIGVIGNIFDNPELLESEE